MASNIAVAVDKDKGSHYALRWTIDKHLEGDQRLTLLHVKQYLPSLPNAPALNVSNGAKPSSNAEVMREVFVPFRSFCTRKQVKVDEVIVEDADIAKGILDYVNKHSIDVLVFGAPSRSGFINIRFKTDVPSAVTKMAPDFCTIYVVNKGKVNPVRTATRPPPPKNSLQHNMQNKSSTNIVDITDQTPFRPHQVPRSSVDRSPYGARGLPDEMEIKSPFNRKGAAYAKPYVSSVTDSDISFVSSGRPSTDQMLPFPDSFGSGNGPRSSISSEYDFRNLGPSHMGNKSIDLTSQYDFSTTSLDNGRLSISSQNMEDVEAEMRRLRQELKQTMEMYSSACKEALTAKQTARELHLWKMAEEKKLEEARLAEEAALALVEREKAKSKAAIEAAEAAQRIAELEAQKRKNAEMKALREAEERKKALNSFTQADLRYRRYTIEEIEAATQDFSDSLKIGEGGYGPVYRGFLDHTPVAIKVLRPDAAQGQSQFQQEIEVLSCIRHPNMVLLLGACPEYGCLVYEYMANGSLDDRLFRRGNSPPISWQKRFQIASEIGTGLLFLHQTKPEPLVHRDLKPGNILLDRNFVSKISDVGLARLVPPSVANNVTQYRMTSTAGTFCYIDPEYQQTGMLGVKSDIYSLGIMLLQIITAMPPMGLTHHVSRAIERGTFPQMLDPVIPDWPVEEALKFAKLALQCAELRKKDRPDLDKVILPELNRLGAIAEENMSSLSLGTTMVPPYPSQSQISTIQETYSEQHSGYNSSRTQSSDQRSRLSSSTVRSTEQLPGTHSSTPRSSTSLFT